MFVAPRINVSSLRAKAYTVGPQYIVFKSLATNKALDTLLEKEAACLSQPPRTEITT